MNEQGSLPTTGTAVSATATVAPLLVSVPLAATTPTTEATSESRTQSGVLLPPLEPLEESKLRDAMAGGSQSPSRSTNRTNSKPRTLDQVEYMPLHSHWYYGQPVFARFRSTPYFYSGNIATYLGAGMFMIIFDDGSINYRVKRDDIILRVVPQVLDEDADASETMEQSDANSSSSGPSAGAIMWFHRDVFLSDRSVMLDMSANPPRQFTSGRAGYEIQEETMGDMKLLDCGVAYEDDSTQISDSDGASEEDMTMTPWQQMTQTFGMSGKLRNRVSRRSSVSSLSQGDRLSASGKSMHNGLQPKGFRQIIQDLLAKRTRKVKPSVDRPEEMAEIVRRMQVKREELRAKAAQGNLGCSRVVFVGEPDGIRTYGTIKSRLPSGEFEIVAEGGQSISVHILPPKGFEFVPSLAEMDTQLWELQHLAKTLYAGRKVQVALYPGTRFSGPGVITTEDDRKASIYHILLASHLRLINVPAEKLVPLKERKKDIVHITDDQFLLCTGRVKVQIGDQVFVRCESDMDGQIEEKLGVLSGIYSNRTAAVDFADGSIGNEISSHLIIKRKRPPHAEDADILSLKNAILMPNVDIDVGYQVKADHPRRPSVESAMVIRKHSDTAFDLRFRDGTIAFGVFPSQMIVDKIAVEPDKACILHEADVGEYVLVWSARFGRHCTAKVTTKTSSGANATYTIVFDYGEQKQNVAAEKIAAIDDPGVLSPTQRLSNISVDSIGFELMPPSFVVGEAVMCRVHASIKYYHGWVEEVNEKERFCTILFDSSERDEHVKFSAMFSVDPRNRFQSLGQPTASGSSSTGNRVGMSFLEDNLPPDLLVRRRHSASSVGSMLMSVAGSIFRARREVAHLERKGSQLVTEIGAHGVCSPDTKS